MARKLILENLMQLAKGIGANTNKYMGTKTNISFLGKGPTKNPLFQNYLPGLETASSRNLGSRDTLIEATEDAMGFATAGKLNDIQLKILTENLSGINKILNPPVLPSAQMFPFPKQGSGIMSVKKTSDPFMGFTPKVVPKTNIPASKINHQMIADKYGIDVELIKGKNWTEVLEIIKNLGYAEGGLADIMQTPRRGRVTHPGGYAGKIGYRGATTDDYKTLAHNKGSTEDFRSLYKQGIKDIEEELLTNELIKILGGGIGGYKDGGLAKILEV